MNADEFPKKISVCKTHLGLEICPPGEPGAVGYVVDDVQSDGPIRQADTMPILEMHMSIAPEHPRFKVEPGSISAHCCFEASVIDTASQDSMTAVCECVDIEDAKRICAALNAAYPPPGQRSWDAWVVIAKEKTPGAFSIGGRLHTTAEAALAAWRSLDAGPYRDNYEVIKVRVGEVKQWD